MDSLSSSKNKKILCISTSLFKSGAENSLLELIKTKTPKFEYILSLPRNNNYDFLLKAVKTFKIPYRWMHLTYNPFRILQFIYSLIVSNVFLVNYVKVNTIKIVYVNTFKSLIYVVLLKYINHCKIICHIRDNISRTKFNRFLFKNCDKVICVSNYINSQLPHGLDNAKVIYGGINTNIWQEQNKSNRMSIGDDENTLVIACIAQFTPWKNLTDYLKASNLILKEQKNVRFWIVGDDLSGRDTKYKKKLLQLREQLNLVPHLHFLGFKENIKEIISRVDIMVHPAINEPFGRVIIEAMAMEKPVVAYNCGGPAEIIENGETGFLVKPGNCQQLAEKSIELIENPKMRITMGKAGRQRAVEKFNINRYVQEMEELFDIVLNEG